MNFDCPVQRRQLELEEHGLNSTREAAELDLKIESLEAQLDDLEWAGEENQHELARVVIHDDATTLLLLQADAIAQATNLTRTQLQALYQEADQLEQPNQQCPSDEEIAESYMHDCKRLGNDPDPNCLALIS